MDIKLNKQMLFWEMKEIVENYNNGKDGDFTKLNLRMEQLFQEAESCQEMIDNKEKLSENEFYNMLNKFAYISGWTDYDCYNVLELAYNMDFINEAVIKTTMHTTLDKSEKKGRDFRLWKEEVGINFVILYTKDFQVDYEHVYTIEEIKKLLAEKKIIIVSKEERDLSWDKDDYEKEEYIEFPYAYDDNNMQYEFFNKNGKFYKYTLMYIKKKLTNKELINILLEHLNHIECEVYDTTDGSNYQNLSWSHVAKEYAKKYEACGYSKRLEKLYKSAK